MLNSTIFGRVLSIHKILVDGVETTADGKTADGKTAQYFVVRGSTGNDAIVDSNGNLVCMLKGSENVPIAQDSGGNLVSVMKGNYDGALKTWKVDSGGRGEMFISDIPDDWGEYPLVGIGELANRIHAPPMTFRKTGTILRWVDFESAAQNYSSTAGGSAVGVRSPDVSCNGSFSFKMSPTSSDYVGLNMYLNDFHHKRITFHAMFSDDGVDDIFVMTIVHFDGSDLLQAVLNYTAHDNKLYYTDWAGASHLICVLKHHHSIYNFNTLEMTVDLSTFKLVGWRAFGQSGTLDVDMDGDTNSQAPHLEFEFRGHGWFTSPTIYVDNLMVIEDVS